MLIGMERYLSLYLHGCGWPNWERISLAGHGSNAVHKIYSMHGTPLTVPTPLATSVFRPTAAAAGEMLAMGDQALMQMADE